jgi:hypothetical protein
VARVDWEQNTNAEAKAGVMMRAAIDAGAADVILDENPDGNIEFMARPAEGAPTTYIAGGNMPFPAWLKLVRSGNQFTGYESGDGVTWALVGTTAVSLSQPGAGYYVGLAVTSHDPSAPPWNTAGFDDVSVSQSASPNLLLEPGFEGYTPPALGVPGWVSDAIRQVPAVSETNEPHTGAQDGACRSTTDQDCGIYQEVTAPATGSYTLTIYADADRPGGLVGVNVNGQSAASADIAVQGFDDYGSYTMGFAASAGDVIRVWMYSPATPGSVVIDDASLTLNNP